MEEEKIYGTRRGQIKHGNFSFSLYTTLLYIILVIILERELKISKI